MADSQTPKPNNAATEMMTWVWICFAGGMLLHAFLPVPGPYGTTIEGVLIGGAIAWKAVKLLDGNKEGK